jgi:hypothetical protein
VTTNRKRRRPRHALPSIGWREWVGLPDLGDAVTKAKVDTGARSSALHAFDLHRFRRNGTEWVRFDLHPLQRKTLPSLTVEAMVADERRVTSSTGKSQLRPVIVTSIELGDQRWPIELTLTRRDEMGFRMLLGRQAIRGRYVVDPGRSYLQSPKRGPR